MSELLQISILAILIGIFYNQRRITQDHNQQNYPVIGRDEIDSLKKEASKKRQFLQSLRQKGKLDTINNDPQDCFVEIDGKKIPYLNFLGTIEQAEKMANIYIEANRKAKEGITNKEAHQYIAEKFEEERIK